MVVLQHQNARAGGDDRALGGGRNAVGDRGRQRDVVRLRTDQARCGAPCTLVLGVGEGLIDQPGTALAQYPAHPGGLGRERQRAPGRGIEEGDLARQVEQRAL